MGNSRPLYNVFLVLSNKHYNFYHKIMCNSPSSIRCCELNSQPLEFGVSSHNHYTGAHAKDLLVGSPPDFSKLVMLEGDGLPIKSSPFCTKRFPKSSQAVIMKKMTIVKIGQLLLRSFVTKAFEK